MERGPGNGPVSIASGSLAFSPPFVRAALPSRPGLPADGPPRPFRRDDGVAQTDYRTLSRECSASCLAWRMLDAHSQHVARPVAGPCARRSEGGRTHYCMTPACGSIFDMRQGVLDEVRYCNAVTVNAGTATSGTSCRSSPAPTERSVQRTAITSSTMSTMRTRVPIPMYMAAPYPAAKVRKRARCP